jgi:CPA1 family monovalent cation:H+ antiporter
MQAAFIQYIFLILIILALVIAANRLKVPSPIMLVLGGTALGFVSSFSKITIDPQLIFFIFLPPLLYEAAWQVSWKEFWKYRRVILSFAFPIVILTAFVIAFVANQLIPGFTLALGFLLGGIISPPDAVSATSIMRQVNVPRTLVSVAEGESLLNDASSLIIFRFALAAIITGQFSLQHAALSFILVIVMGTLIGVAIAVIFYAIHKWLPTTSSIEIALTLVTPYCMYYVAEHFHFSGVLAVVSGGLFLSSRRNEILTYESRVQGFNVWTNLVFVLNGLVFMLIGLQLPSIVKQLGDFTLINAIEYGLVISFVLILTRLLCTLGASVFTRFMSRFITVADDNPGWRSPLILGWAGMRGVVSLAAALSIPLMIADNPFPHRNLILFITFIVILVTLVFQGLTLPWLISKIKPGIDHETLPQQKAEIYIQRKITEDSIRFLNEKYPRQRHLNDHLKNLYEKLETDLDFFRNEIKETENKKDLALGEYEDIYLDLLQHQRNILNDMNRIADCDEELIRKYQTLIDMEEMHVRERMLGEEEVSP